MGVGKRTWGRKTSREFIGPALCVSGCQCYQITVAKSECSVAPMKWKLPGFPDVVPTLTLTIPSKAIALIALMHLMCRRV